MNCEHCGAPITLEEKYCAHCGKPNTMAAQHVRDMAAYKNEFEKTRHGVYRTLAAYKGITARLIIFVVAVVIMIVAFVMMQGVYSMQRNHTIRETKAHADEVAAQVEEYLEHGDYVGLAAYSEHTRLNSYALEKSSLGKYSPVVSMASRYSFLYDDVMQLYTSDDPGSEYSRKNIGNDYESLYEVLDDPEGRYFYGNGDDELVDRTIEGISRQTDALFMTYLGFDAAEIEEMHTLTPARRNVMLEEHISEFIETK